MTQGEVINKLSKECCLALGDFDHYQTVRAYIQMALDVGVNHFQENMVEVVALYRDGLEAGRFKSTTEASKKLGIDRKAIHEVLRGAHHTTGGLQFIKTKDYELVKRPETIDCKHCALLCH